MTVATRSGAAGVDQKSRYGATSPIMFEDATDGSLGVEDISAAVVQLRAAFASEKTMSREWRVDQLKALRTLLTEGRGELCEAMRVDLHKHPFEGVSTELGLVQAEIDTALANLDGWMRPSFTANSAMNIPCWSSTQQDPLGLVLIMGAWNYPMQLTFAPLVGAIAGGNCVMIKPGSYAPASSHAISRLVQKYLDGECIKVAEGGRKVTGQLLEERYDKVTCLPPHISATSPAMHAEQRRASWAHACPSIQWPGNPPCIPDAGSIGARLRFASSLAPALSARSCSNPQPSPFTHTRTLALTADLLHRLWLRRKDRARGGCQAPDSLHPRAWRQVALHRRPVSSPRARS